MSLLPAERPRCGTHGIYMEYRPQGTPEQAFSGTWYVCPGLPGERRCGTASLLDSPELRAQLAQQRDVIHAREERDRMTTITGKLRTALEAAAAEPCGLYRPARFTGDSLYAATRGGKPVLIAASTVSSLLNTRKWIAPGDTIEVGGEERQMFPATPAGLGALDAAQSTEG